MYAFLVIIIGLLLAGIIKGLLKFIEDDSSEDEAVKNDREIEDEELDWSFGAPDVPDLDPDNPDSDLYP